MSQAEVVSAALMEAIKLNLREKPFEKITIDDICNDSHVGRRTFYRYFKDKYDLLNRLYDHEFCEVVEQKDYRSIWDFYPDICAHLYSDRKFFLNAFSVTGQNSFREFCNDKLYPILMSDFGSSFSSEREAAFVIKHITYATFDGFQWWLAQEPCMPPDEYEKYSRELIIHVAKGIAGIGSSREE